MENKTVEQTASVIELAIKFHNIYEKLAPNFGYETREDTKQFNPDTPNGKLMIAVCDEIIKSQLSPLSETASAIAKMAEIAELKEKYLEEKRCKESAMEYIEIQKKEIKLLISSCNFFKEMLAEGSKIKKAIEWCDLKLKNNDTIWKESFPHFEHDIYSHENAVLKEMKIYLLSLQPVAEIAEKSAGVWVSPLERFPNKTGWYFVKKGTTENAFKEVFHFDVLKVAHKIPEYWNEIYVWLDESQSSVPLDKVEPLKEDDEKLKEYFKAYIRKDMFSTYDDAEFEFYMRRPSIEADYCHRVDLMTDGYKYALQSSPNIKKESVDEAAEANNEFTNFLDKIIEFATIFKSPENEIKLVKQIRVRFKEWQSNLIENKEEKL